MKEKFFSIKTKMTIGVILMCFLIGALAIFAVNRISTSIIDREYSDKAEMITQAVVHTIDPDEVLEVKNAILDIYDGIDNVVPSTEWGSDEWNEYIANYESVRDLQSFKDLQDSFRAYQDIYKVDCFYLSIYILLFTSLYI